MADSNYDVVVIGGGPAGSTAATLVAREGRRVLLLDREAFPRFRIGESLMPAAYWTLERLGVLDRMQKSPFPRKHSVQFFSRSGKSSMPFYFSEFDGHESSITWQVDRAKFDQMLLDNARQAGVEVREQVNVRELLFDDSRVTGVTAEAADGSRQRIGARVVVDASGQTGFISRRLGLKNPDSELKHASLYTRFKGATRDAGRDEGATLIMSSEVGKTWFWFIPLADDYASVGVVGPIGTLIGNRSGDLQAMFDEEVARCPGIRARIENAEQAESISAVRDFSYISRRIAGDGWVMAGDAFGFLDPIYSTGVFLALRSGEMAADSINEAFESDDFSARQLGSHGDRYVAGMESMRKLVYAYYDESFHIGRFLRDNPDCREAVVHLLIGNVFRRPVDALFELMGRVCKLPESRTLASLEETL